MASSASLGGGVAERGRARRSGDERAPLSGPAAAQPVARGTADLGRAGATSRPEAGIRGLHDEATTTGASPRSAPG